MDNLLICHNELKFEKLQYFSQIVSKLRILPIPEEAKAKAMPGRLYIHTRNNNKKKHIPERDVIGVRTFVYGLI
jgi:hypothetical protein